MPTNPDFNPMHSSNDIWRNQDLTRCLTDDLDAMDSDISALKTGKANTDHTHTGYALTEHTHTAADVGAAPAAHTHDYAPTSHSHGQSDITGLGSALQGKADLVDGKVPAAQLPAYVDDVVEYTSVSNFPETGEQGKIYVATDTNKTYRWSGTGYVEISASIALGETASTAYRGDRGKTAYEHSQNGDVHVTAVQKTEWSSKANGDHTHNYAAASHTHAQSDITGLASALEGKSPTGHTHTPADIGAASEGHTHTPASIGAATASHTHIPADIGAAAASHTHTPASIGAAAASHTHALASTTADGQMSKEDKAKLDGIAAGANQYTHPSTHPVSMITGLHDVATSGSYNDLSNKPTIPTVPSSLPANGGNADTVDGKHASDFATATHTHSGYAASSHTHSLSNITGLLGLLATTDDGDAKLKLSSGSTSSLLTKIAELGMGIHTFYSASGNTGNPKTTEAWRGFVFKTGANYGLVYAAGSIGSIYTNYLDGGTWRGWKCLWDNSPAPLWSGAMYMSSPNSTPQTVTPSKKLSECRTGWLLLWSDYDPGSGANDSDFATTIIPKRNPSGGTWGGKAFLCDIPRYVGSDPDDTSTEKRIIKPIYVHDDCIKGSYQNASGDRNDVVLRAVYEI